MSRWRLHLPRIALLLALTAAVQLWTISHAVVPSLDSVRYVASAQAIEQDGVWQCWRKQSEHLLFPLWVATVHRALSPWTDAAQPGWALAVQVAAVIPLILTVVPLYLGALRLVSSRGALIAALLFTVVSEVSRLGADGLSDSTQLLFFSIGWWLLLEAFTRLDFATEHPNSSWWPVRRPMLAAGAAAGIALLARAEVVVLVPSAIAALLACQMRHLPKPIPWRNTTIAAACVLIGWSSIWGPFLALTGSDRLDLAIARMLGRPDVDEESHSTALWRSGAPPLMTANGNAQWLDSDGQPLVFPFKETASSSRFHGLSASTAEFVNELFTVFQFWIGGLALCGFIHRVQRGPRGVDVFAHSFFILYAAAAMVHGAMSGYLATRHLIPLLLPGLAWAGQGSLVFERVWRRGWRRARNRPVLAGLYRSPFNERLWRAARPLVSLGLVAIVATVACAAKTLLPLHKSRTPHRQAAAWLSEHAPQEARVLDTRGWTGLYSGRDTYRYDAARSAFTDPDLAYIVVEQQELEQTSPRSRSLKSMLTRFGEPQVAFPAANSVGSHVVIYRWHPERLAAVPAERGNWR